MPTDRIRFRCPHCHHRVEAASEVAGTRINCPYSSCARPFYVPKLIQGSSPGKCAKTMQQDVQHVDADPPLMDGSPLQANGDKKRRNPANGISSEIVDSSSYQVIEDKPDPVIEGKHGPRKTKKKKKGRKKSIRFKCPCCNEFIPVSPEEAGTCIRCSNPLCAQLIDVPNWDELEEEAARESDEAETSSAFYKIAGGIFPGTFSVLWILYYWLGFVLVIGDLHPVLCIVILAGVLTVVLTAVILLMKPVIDSVFSEDWFN